MSTTKQIILEEGILPGTKWSTVNKILKSGINTVGDLARQTPKPLAEQSGVGADTCEKYIAIALTMINEGVITGAQLLEQIRDRKKLSTGSTLADEILRSDDDRKFDRPGGIESSTTTEIGGENGSGKTQIMHQLAINSQLPYEDGGLEGKVMWIDTENTFRPDRIIQICDNRGYDGMKMLSGIFYEKALSTQHQQDIVNKLPRLCQENNIKLVIVDSMMAHLRAEYIGRGTLADRQQTLNAILQKLGKLGLNHGITIIYTNQVMSKPDAYSKSSIAVGGHVMGHASTLRLFIRKGRQGTRVLKVTKSPYLPENEAPLMISDYGVEDVETFNERTTKKSKKKDDE